MPTLPAAKWTPVRETWQTEEESKLDNQKLSAINNRNDRMAEVESIANERKAQSAPDSAAQTQVERTVEKQATILKLTIVLERFPNRCMGQTMLW